MIIARPPAFALTKCVAPVLVLFACTLKAAPEGHIAVGPNVMISRDRPTRELCSFSPDGSAHFSTLLAPKAAVERHLDKFKP